MGARRAVVIGAGVGGLCAAIRLASIGWQVTVLEQNEAVGGKMSQVSDSGFRWDTGPSVITMRHVLEDTFAAAGRRLDDYLTLLPVDPLTRYFWPDGAQLDASADVETMAARVAEISPDDVDGYRRYLEYASEIHRVTGPVFIYDKPPRPSSFLRVRPLDWLKADPLRTMDSAIRSHVKSSHLRQFLGRFATYVGGSPYRAPATLNVIAHIELSGGVWYPQGGIYAIASALEKLATELGVEIRTGCPAASIVIEHDRAAGVLLRSGERLNADAVVSNLDVSATYSQLLPRESRFAARLARLQRQEPSCSGFIMLLGVDASHEALAHHNIFFSSDYSHEFRQIFQDGTVPDEPTVYIAITAKTDETHAPAGCENWFVLVNVPALLPSHDWPAQAPRYRDLVLSRIAEFGFDIRDKIRTEHILTPPDLERLTGAYRGALYGASANSRWTAFRRPHNRCPDLRGLYFAGGTTHPGGGVPMVALSGKIAASLIIEDFERNESR